MDEIVKRSIPVISSGKLVLYPGRTLPVRSANRKVVTALQKAKDVGWLLVVAQHSDYDDVLPKNLYQVGTLAKIDKVKGNRKSGFHTNLSGVARFRVSSWGDNGSYIEASGDVLSDIIDADQSSIDLIFSHLKSISLEILSLVPADTRRLEETIETIEEPGFLVHLCAESIDMDVERKQKILEETNLKLRSLYLLDLLQEQKENLSLQKDISEKLSQRMTKSQREGILREHMKTIQEELGQGKVGAEQEYLRKIRESQMPPNVEKLAIEELDRLESMADYNPESQIIRNYLDLVCSLPWSISKDKVIDLPKSRKSLENDHFGLEKIKDRIIQQLAVMKLKQDRKGQIILFVGPPGVGKTSLGKSIAKALGRDFVRVSLGGVRDDSEIRGHRRTYIGAMPGRIVQGLKRAGSQNPVFLLDEIDKLSRGFGGDPASALLEVLDPEQNSDFTDHYLDVSFDLSKVFFIATANNLADIPGPLRDRMEIIELTGYTEEEKLHIAKKHLLSKQLKDHGIKKSQLKLTEKAMKSLINDYTRESGVRGLNRRLGEVCRTVAEKIIDGADLPISINPTTLEHLLGPHKYKSEAAQLKGQVGVVTGLAWTPVGGDILFIEAIEMVGKGKLNLTGQLGDVMKESAQIAMSILRSRFPLLLVDHDKKDIHIHVPAGAIPKDGPSAGVAMLTTLASLFSGRVVNPKLAMTGEITLRGAVRPVGGIKEKVLAAYRAGMTEILLCDENEKDLLDVSDKVKNKLEFKFVSNVDEVLDHSLGLDTSHALLQRLSVSNDSEMICAPQLL